MKNNGGRNWTNTSKRHNKRHRPQKEFGGEYEGEKRKTTLEPFT